MPTFRPLPLLACALGACALAPAPALAAAHHAASAAQSGVVLSAAHHRVQLVDHAHRVTDARVRSTHGLRRGAVVTIRGGSAKVTGRAHRVAFLGRVARSSKHGTVVKLGDGSSFRLGTAGAHGARAASALTVDLQGLTVGEELLITISTDAAGNVAIAIKVVPAATNIGDEQQTSGYVTDDSGGGVFAIRTGDGSGLRFDDPQQLLEAADASQCDTVDVGYHADGHTLVADSLRVTGRSDQGSCAPDQQPADGSGGDEIDGVVTALAADGSSLTLTPDDGSAAATIQTSDASVLDGVNVGDDVAVMTDASGVATEVDVLDTSGEDPGPGGGGGDDGSGDDG
jgi:hypothetical protein